MTSRTRNLLKSIRREGGESERTTTEPSENQASLSCELRDMTPDSEASMIVELTLNMDLCTGRQYFKSKVVQEPVKLVYRVYVYVLLNWIFVMWIWREQYIGIGRYIVIEVMIKVSENLWNWNCCFRDRNSKHLFLFKVHICVHHSSWTFTVWIPLFTRDTHVV